MTKSKFNLRNVATACLAAFLVFSANTAKAQTYHEDDKEGLRIFLRQPSAQAGKINAEQLGLSISDTLDWQNDESWVTKVDELVWNAETPKRLIKIKAESYGSGGWCFSKIAGTLDASKWAKLQILYCHVNKLTALNISANTELEELVCYENLLNTLDVSTNTKLTKLNCDDNKLSVLDVSTCTVLEYLECWGNQLTALNVSGCTKLKELRCSFNKLTALNVSECTNLKKIWCRENQLISIDLGGLNLEHWDYVDQTVSLTLYRSGNKYEFTIPLNNPTFSDSKITYASGKITSTDEAVYRTNFTVETNLSGKQLSGKINFTYSENTPPTGIAVTESITTLRVYPNPTNRQLIIKNGQLTIENTEYQIFSVVGQVLLQGQLGQEGQIDVSNLANGMYFLKIGNKTVRFLKD